MNEMFVLRIVGLILIIDELSLHDDPQVENKLKSRVHLELDGTCEMKRKII